MIDPKLFRNDIQQIAAGLKKRGYELNVALFAELEEKRKSCQVAAEQIQQQRNQLSKEIGKLKAQGADTQKIQDEVLALKSKLEEAESALASVDMQMEQAAFNIPNIPDESVPVGHSELDNIVLKKVGEIKRTQGLDHLEILEKNGLILMDEAAYLSGTRFSVLKGAVARLHRALIQYMLDYHAQAGYVEYYVPYLVQGQALFGTGQLPKFEEDLFALKGDRNLYLIPTAEVPLTNLFADKILAGQEFPIRMMAHTPCFRSEAGSYGKDTKGLFRQHQFEKVELVLAALPEQSAFLLNEMVDHVSGLLSSLELPHQLLQLCTGDMGFGSAKTIDLEVWLPSQQKYREISSCSMFGDFQARRMKARFKKTQQDKTQFIHTLNGSGVAVGRALIAMIENHADETGCYIPVVLRPYLKGVEFLPWN